MQFRRHWIILFGFDLMQSNWSLKKEKKNVKIVWQWKIMMFMARRDHDFAIIFQWSFVCILVFLLINKVPILFVAIIIIFVSDSKKCTRAHKLCDCLFLELRCYFEWHPNTDSRNYFYLTRKKKTIWSEGMKKKIIKTKEIWICVSVSKFINTITINGYILRGVRAALCFYFYISRISHSCEFQPDTSERKYQFYA